MPHTKCQRCGAPVTWCWEDAFDKFGFGDGDGEVMTDDVVAVLEQAGYEATSHRWGLHNEVIVSITKNGVEQIPASTKVGYDNPRRFLPERIVRLLDEKLPDPDQLSERKPR